MGTVKLVPRLRLASGECLNFTSAPLCPQEDPLLFKMQSGGGVDFHPTLPSSSLASSAFCRPLSSLASALQTWAQISCFVLPGAQRVQGDLQLS